MNAYNLNYKLEARSPVQPDYPPWPVFAADEIEAATDVLRSGACNYWTGQEGRRFEQEFADYVGCPHGIALANGTVGLELALLALNIGSGDEVVVPCRTFIASASAVVMRGATPVLADVDPESQNLTAKTIEAVLSPRTKAIIAVHLAGWPCDMDPILELARARGLKVIEDCAQAHGAVYRGRRVGSIGDVGVFSFCQDKIMTTGGEGGMLTTHDTALWETAWSFKDHGKNHGLMRTPAPTSSYRWVHESFGTNWRMTEMQAAIGRVQLRKLDGWLAARQRNGAILSKCFQAIPALRITVPPEDISHACYKYYAFVRPERLKPGWYREMAFQQAGFVPAEPFPVAKHLGQTSLMFPVHPTLAPEDMEAMCEAVGEVVEWASLPQ